MDMKPVKIILVIVPAVIVAVLLMVFAKGDGHIVAAICDSLAPNLPLDCIHDGVPGAISLLDDGIWSASDLVSKSTSHGVMFVISAVLASIPLFLVASDYGRLIYIHVSSLSLLTLAMTQDVNNTPLQLNFKSVIVWGGAFLFVAGWRLIHWGATFGKTFPLFQSAIKYLFT
jgi:hypothetical protein